MRKNKTINLLSTHLKKARRRSGLSLRQLSKRTRGKISNPYFSQLENGRNTSPSREKLLVIAAVKSLKIKKAELLRLAGYAVTK